MTDQEIWLRAYCAALTGLHAFSGREEPGTINQEWYSVSDADLAATEAANLALASYHKRWAAPEVRTCETCKHKAIGWNEVPCIGCDDHPDRDRWEAK